MSKEGSSSVVSVFSVSLILCVLVALWGVVDPQHLTTIVKSLTDNCLLHLDWFFLLSCSGFIVISLFLAFSHFGEIKLGKDDDQPEFSTLSWLAMLFAAGMGSGLVFWGVAEPLGFFANPPPGAPQADFDRARWTLVVSNLHWGFHAWSIYAVTALTIGYFGFRKGTSLLASGPLLLMFKGRWVRAFAGAVDVLAILAVIFGVVGSLGMGTLLINSGLSRFLGTPDGSIGLSLVVLFSLTVVYMISAGTGLNKGIQLLSNINIVIALVLLLFILIAGPTHFIFSAFVTSIGDYLSNITMLATRLFPFRDEMQWSRDWTLTYLVWWIAWAPFVGIFIARISRGRTIRNFVSGVVFLPSLFSLFWFAVFGGAGLHIELFGDGGIAAIAASTPNQALFALFQNFVGTEILNVLALVLMFIFLVTSADSASFVLGMLSTKGSLNPPTFRKLIWGVVMGLMVLAALFSQGGIAAIKALAISGALPFIFVMILHCYCLLRALHLERKQKLLLQKSRTKI